jgi:hypothetical protein
MLEHAEGVSLILELICEDLFIVCYWRGATSVIE